VINTAAPVCAKVRPKTDEETGTDEHINALGGGLYDSNDDLSKSMGSQ